MNTKPPRRLGHLEGKLPVPDVFFEPLPEDELELWEGNTKVVPADGHIDYATGQVVTSHGRITGFTPDAAPCRHR